MMWREGGVPPSGYVSSLAQARRAQRRTAVAAQGKPLGPVGGATGRSGRSSNGPQVGGNQVYDPSTGQTYDIQTAQFGSIAGLLAQFGPQILAALGGTALGAGLGGLLGQGGEGEAAMPGGVTPQGESLQWPWDTPPGEGFIAPWTEQVTLPGGLTGQLGAEYPNAFGGVGVAYSWSTGTAVFFRLMDGRIAVQKKNGVWKIYRPKKHIVLSTNPRLNQLRKFDRAYSRLNKIVKKFKGRPKTVTIGPPTKYLSPVEKAIAKAGG